MYSECYDEVYLWKENFMFKDYNLTFEGYRADKANKLNKQMDVDLSESNSLKDRANNFKKALDESEKQDQIIRDKTQKYHNHFPIQNWLKIESSKSSVAVFPFKNCRE
jgi:hypothetical protein